MHPSNHQHVPSHPFQPSVYPFIHRTRPMPRCERNGINSAKISRPAGTGTPPIGAETTSMYAHRCECITAWHICVCGKTKRHSLAPSHRRNNSSPTSALSSTYCFRKTHAVGFDWTCWQRLLVVGCMFAVFVERICHFVNQNNAGDMTGVPEGLRWISKDDVPTDAEFKVISRKSSLSLRLDVYCC